MTFTGCKSSKTILGSHACRFDKLENFAITFWKKPTFTFPKILLNCLKNSPPEKLNGFGILKTFLQEFQWHLWHDIHLSIKLLFLYFFNRRSYKSCLLSFISFQISGSIEVKEKVQLLQTSVKNGTNGNTNGNIGCQVSNWGIQN